MKISLIAALLLISANALALGPFYVDFHGSAGKATMEVKDEKKSPDGYQYGVGSTIGWKFAFIYLGASADYYKVAQTTKPNDSFGNRGGTRTNLLSPTLGLALGNLRFKFDYQMMGDYKLEKKTNGGEAVSYEEPKGYRGYAGYRLGAFTEAGVFYETVDYAKEKIGSSKKKLDNKMNVSQFGLMFLFRI